MSTPPSTLPAALDAMTSGLPEWGDTEILAISWHIVKSARIVALGAENFVWRSGVEGNSNNDHGVCREFG
jgi:hypothetical protein